jgi:hypothetical protein
MSAASETPPVTPAPPPAVVQAAADDKFEIVFYRDQESTAPGHCSISWERFAEFVTTCAEASPCTVADGPFKCAGKKCVYKSHSALPANADNNMAWAPTEIEGSRLDKNVRFLTALVLDFDHVSWSVGEAIDEKLSAWEHIAHTTHNHRGGDDNCLRHILRLSRKVHANQWHRFLPAAIAYLGVTVDNGEGERQPDPTCKNRSRFYYLPSHPGDAPRGAARVPGKVLDVDEVLSWAEQHLPMPAPFDDSVREALPEISDWDLDGPDILEAIDLASNYFPTRRRHEFAAALAGMLRRAGASEDDARWLVREICVRGGSTDPDKRVTTVPHTYGLSDNSFMTGLTRVAEILNGEDVEGLKIAKEIGDYFTNARNEACLRGFTPRNLPANGANGANGAHAGGTNGANGYSTSLVPSGYTNLEDVRAAIAALASRRASSLEREDKIDAIILRRVLNGEPIAKPGGYGDVETVREDAERGVTRDMAIRQAVGAIAFVVPEGTSWEAVAPILQPSLSSTIVDPGEDWMREAAKIYRSADLKRRAQSAERAAAEAARKDRILERMGAGSGGGGAPPSPPNGPNWKDDLKKGAGGLPTVNPFNVELILKNDENFCGMIKWNEFDKILEIHGGVLVAASAKGAEHIVTGARNYISGKWDMTIEFNDLKRQIMAVAHNHSYDPLAEHLRSRVWDRTPRIEEMLIRYFGVKDTAHTRRISRRWMIGAVARVFEPGCKFDNVLVFEEIQGAKKSTAFEALGGGFYTSTEINFRDKDAKMLAATSWIVELAELDSLRKSDRELIKAFLTQRWDKYRPPFGADMIKSPRRCVFVGSTNEKRYLTDPTGARRFWPVKCGVNGDIDMNGLLRDHDLLWGEAVAIYFAHLSCPACHASTDTVRGQKPRCADHRWWLDKKEEKEAARDAGEREEDAPWMAWSDKIIEWWKNLKIRPATMTVNQIAFEVGELPVDRVTKGVQTEIGWAMEKLGFIRVESKRHYIASPELLRMTPGRGLYAVPGGKKDEEKKAEGDGKDDGDKTKK